MLDIVRSNMIMAKKKRRDILVIPTLRPVLRAPHVESRKHVPNTACRRQDNRKAIAEMSTAELQEDLSHIVGQMDDRPEDIRELCAQLHRTLDEIRGLGQPIPQDYIGLVRQLENEFCALSQGR